MTDALASGATRARLAFRLLASEDVERVYAAALERLAAYGVVPACAEAREALLAAGATPLPATGASSSAAIRETAAAPALVLASALVEPAAARAPKRIVLGGRTPAADVVLEAGAALLGAGGLPARKAEPLAGGSVREATADDLEDACRLADGLDDVSVVVGPPLTATGAESHAARVAEIGRTLAATTKHLQVTGVSSPGVAATAADMAAALRDDEAAARRRPPLSLLGGAESFPAAAVFARGGLPVGAVLEASLVGPGHPACGGARAEGTTMDSERMVVAERLIAFVADVLAANVAIQALAPGAAYIAPVWPTLAGLPAAGPVAVAFMVAASQVLTRAGLPVAAAAFATSAPEPDWLACTDGSFATLSVAAAGASVLTGAGSLRAGGVFSPRQLVADAEIHSWCSTVTAGIAVDDETLALEQIKEVGIGGNFLGQKHTRRHMKDIWRPRLLDRSPWDAWVTDGCTGAAERAVEVAGALLAGHEVEPLDRERAATLERIIATAGLQ